MSHGGDWMELDYVNGNGYQGSSTKVNIEPVQTTNIGKSNKIDQAITREIVGESSVGAALSNDTMNPEIKKSIDEINSKLNKQTEAIFGIHDETNIVTIKIIDKESKEVLKEIPPEKTLEMIAKIWEVAGLLVDEKL